jgi:cyclophilin family peptidyl-prolyl cis-trans isomerase
MPFFIVLSLPYYPIFKLNLRPINITCSKASIYSKNQIELKNSICLLVAFLFVLSSCEKKPVTALIETDMGNITVELFDSTPLHRDNFVKMINEKYYDGLLFHRVIKGFMIQSGDPDSRTSRPDQMLGMGGPGYTIPAEIAATHFKGALAMAKKGNNRDSEGSQFYIVHGTPQNEHTLTSFERQKGIKYNKAQRQKYLEVGGTPQIDMEYTVFGQVISGIDIIDQITDVPIGENDRPVKDIKIKTIKLKK